MNEGWRKEPQLGSVEAPTRGTAHLEADLEVLAVLAAAAELAAETLVDVAAALVRAIAAVVLTVAKQRLGHAAPAAAQELRGGVALVLWGDGGGGSAGPWAVWATGPGAESGEEAKIGRASCRERVSSPV